MALNILMISTSFVRGGAGLLARKLGNSLEPKKYQVNYYHPSDNMFSIYLRMGIAAIISNDQIIGRDITKLKIYRNADIIHLHNLHGGYFPLYTLAQMSNDKKIIWTLHDLWAIHGKSPGLNDDYSRFIYPPMFFNTIKAMLHRKANIYQKCSNLHLVAPSIWMKKQLEGSILGEFPVTVISNGIDTDKYKPADKSKLKKQLGLNGNIALIVASGGVYNQDKGGSQMLELARAIPSVTFVIIGGKSNLNFPNVIYIREIEVDQLISYYQAADFLVSLSQAESFGLSIVEAQSCGTPVFAYDAGAVSEVVFDKDHLVKVGELNFLVEKINHYLMTSKKVKESTGKDARKYVLNNFPINKMVKSYQKLYNSL